MDALHPIAVYGVFGLAILTFGALLVISAPYGRHGRSGWGPTLPAKLAWVLMELPAVALFAFVFFQGTHSGDLVPLVLFGIWQVHYLHRTFVYPIRMPSGVRPMPLSVSAMGFVFQSLNSWLNARYVSHLGSYADEWLLEPPFLIGAALFAIGMFINVRSDSVLLRLRSHADYQIPRGGLFDYVTSPNYLGELLEWIGWAIATWSLPGLAFAVYTFANLAPRALAHRRWYRERFDEYPRRRRALIPFLL